MILNNCLGTIIKFDPIKNMNCEIYYLIQLILIKALMLFKYFYFKKFHFQLLNTIFHIIFQHQYYFHYQYFFQFYYHLIKFIQFFLLSIMDYHYSLDYQFFIIIQLLNLLIIFQVFLQLVFNLFNNQYLLNHFNIFCYLIFYNF